MIDVLAQIDEEVKIAVAKRNGKIVVAALKSAATHCPNCNYPQNAEYFHRRVIGHRLVSIDAHRARRRLEHDYDRSRKRSLERVMQDRYLVNRRINSHARVHEYWPCPACMARFNPTGRIKHKPANRPQKGSLL